MSKLQAKIYTTTDTSNTLIFTNKDIVAISSNTKVIENETTPSFDILPNSGSLVVKDTNLNLYNKALNGEFDEFRYVVEFYINNKLFACHIINQRPYYDYEAKTCTFYLGNAIDYTTTAPYNGYVYPLQSQSLYTIFYNLMVDIFGISNDDFEDLVNATFGKYQTINGAYSGFKFKGYFQAISITYPYIGQTTQREALRTVLLMAQCGLILDRNNKFKLIRLDGYTTTANLFDNTYIINENQTKQGFIPSIILDNKYNKINISQNVALKNTYYGEEISKYSYEPTTSIVDTNNNNYNYTFYRETSAGHRYVFLGLYQEIEYINCFSERTHINKYQNENLKEIFEIFLSLKKESFNPNVSVIASKTTNKYNGQMTVSNSTFESFVRTDTTPYETIIEEVNFVVLDVYEQSATFTFNDDVYGELSISGTIQQKNPATFTLKFDETYNYYTVSLINFLCGIASKTYFGYGLKNSDGASPAGTYLAIEEEVTITPKFITITYFGNCYIIEFNENSFSITKTTSENQLINQYSLANGSEIYQSNALFAINSVNLIENIGNNLLNVFENGLHTGEITVIHDDYNTFCNYVYNLEENIEGFNVGSQTPITKTLNKLRIKALPKKVIVTNISSTTTTYELINNEYSDSDFGIVFNEDTNSLTFSYKGDFYWPIKNCVVKYNVNIEPEEIGVTKNKQFFENGDKVIPCKNNIPIMQVNNQPIVYQVVDNDISIEGGVAFQKLILREVKQL